MEESNRYKIENKQLKKSILEKNAAMNAMYTSLVNVNKNIATTKTKKRLLGKLNKTIFFSATPNGTKSARTGDSLVKTIPPKYLVFAVYVKNAGEPHCCRKVFEVFCFTSELRKSWCRCGENVQELRALWEDVALFTPSNSVQMCSSRIQYGHTISSAELGPHKIPEH